MSQPFERLSGKRILITGASGFIGAHLTRRLAGLGIEVHAVSRTAQDESHWPVGVKWYVCNLENREETNSLFRSLRPDIVYHLSGLASGRSEMDYILPTFYSLAVSTVHVLTAATELGCQRILVPGSFEEPNPQANEWVPGSPYAAAKYVGSQYAQMFHQLYGTPVVLPIPFMTYGPGQPRFKLIPSVIESLLEGRNPELASGKRKIDWIYIDDMVEGFVAGAYTEGIEGKRIDLGSGVVHSIQEVVSRLCAIVNPDIVPRFGAIEDRFMEKTQIANVEDTLRQLEWKPVVRLQEGLERTVEWMRSTRIR